MVSDVYCPPNCREVCGGSEDSEKVQCLNFKAFTEEQFEGLPLPPSRVTVGWRGRLTDPRF